MLHIEINGEASAREWKALKVLAAVMLGEPAEAPVVMLADGSGNAIDDAEESAPILSQVPAPPLSQPIASGGDASEEKPTAPLAGVAVDSEGIPWDGRIHASTKTATKKGLWTLKRGVDENLVNQVKAELRQALAAPGVTIPPVPGAMNLDPAAAFGGTQAAPDSVPPPPVAPAATETSAPLGEFARIMRIVSEKQAAKTLSTEMVSALVVQLGLTSVRDFATRPDLIPAFEALLP